MYFKAMSMYSDGNDVWSEHDALALCVLLNMCSSSKMESGCQDVVNIKNRSSFTDDYHRPKEAIFGMLSIFSVLGTVGNALVLYVYVRKKNKLASTVFIICLAANDFMTSCIIMPFTMTMESLDFFILYDGVCKIYFFLITCNVPFAAFIMVAIAVDRYLCICKPHCHLLDSRRSQIGVIFLALMSATFGVLTALFHGVYTTEAFSVTLNDTDIIDQVRADILESFQSNSVNVSHCVNGTGINCTNPSNSTDVILEAMVNTRIDECTAADEQIVVYTGQCLFNEIIFSTSFRMAYQKVYASMFLVSFVIVFVLYITIYRSVLAHRGKRLRARQKTNVRLLRDASVMDTHSVSADAPLQNGFEMSEMTREKRKAMLESDSGLKEKYLLANIRTALMLFMVTVVFVLAFLPSWLMAHNVIDFNAVIFHFYFAYNVSNPIIYAFMNYTFRKELHDVICCRNVRSRT